jgi:hypothetical protein
MTQHESCGFTPVLLLFFNRKHTLRCVLEQIREYKCNRLYLASDGPRTNVHNEAQVINEIRQYVLDSIDWDCEVKTLFRDKNLGCKSAVHGAIQWFFSQEEKGIVIEDDVVVSLNFFYFCELALDLYQNDLRVGSISGRNDLGCWGSQDTFTARRFSCWGWASWSDRVKGMDVDYGYDPAANYTVLLNGATFEECCYVRSVLGFLQTNQVNSWAYPYDLNFRRINQLQLYPRLNMVKNIGYGESGTHSFSYHSDSVKYYPTFSPQLKSIPLSDDQEFVKRKLISEYRSLFILVLSSFSRYLGWLRRLRRLISGTNKR